MLGDWWPNHAWSVTCQSELCVGHYDTVCVCQGVSHGSVGFKLCAGGSVAKQGTDSLGENADRLGVSGPILES